MGHGGHWGCEGQLQTTPLRCGMAKRHRESKAVSEMRRMDCNEGCGVEDGVVGDGVFG